MQFYIEYHDARADKYGNRRYTLHWLQDYTVDPINHKSIRFEGREMWPRAQSFNANPKEHNGAKSAIVGLPPWFDLLR